MRRLMWPLAGLLVLLLSPALASAQGVDLHSGQKVAGGFEDPGNFTVFRFHAIEGDLVTIKLTVPGKSDLEPILQLLGPEDDFYLPTMQKGKFTLKKEPIPVSGLHFFVIYAAGTTGEYKLSFTQKHAKVEPETRTLGTKYSVMLPAGAKVTFEVKAEKGIDLYPGIDLLVDPMGNDILDPDLLKEKKKKAKLKALDCPHFGWYTLYLSPREGTGSAIIKTKFKPAKPPVKKLSDENAFDSMVILMRSPDGSGGFDYGLHAEVRGPSVTAATLRFPDGSGLKPRKLETDVDDPGEFWLDLEGQFPDGVYTLIITQTGEVTSEREFVIGGSWPTGMTLFVKNGSTTRPTVSWTGGDGANYFHFAAEEYDPFEDDWEEEYAALLTGATRSHTVPEGPLDRVPHAFLVLAITEGLKATDSEYQPK